MNLRSLAVAALGAAILIAAPARADLDKATRQKVFLKAWTLVRDHHWDPTLGGVNWDAVRRKYAPRIAAAKSDAAFYGILQAMLGELKQSHFNVIPPAAYVASDKKARGGGETGLTVSLVEGEAVVTEVEPGSPAEAAGLKPGFAVTAVDGQALAPVLAKVRARKLRPAAEQVEVRMTLLHLLGGTIGSSAKVAFRDADDQLREAKVERVAPKGQIVEVMNLPPIPVRTEARELSGGVGYIRFNIFLMVPALAQIKAAIARFHDAPGLVIDLRGNPGGMGAMAMPIAEALFPKGSPARSLGSMKQRNAELRFSITNQAENLPRFAGPVAILVDEMSLSTSEVLAGGLQETGRVAIVGRTTGGMVLPSSIEQIGGGVRLQYALADFKTPRGILLEGRGVIPDIPVPLTRKALRETPDPILEAALAYLTSQKGKS